MKSSPQNNSIALTIEGQVRQDFPTAKILDRIQKHNVILNIVKDEPEIPPEAETDMNEIDFLNALTIEDKPVIIDLLEDFFEKLGHKNLTLTSGEKGLAYIKNARQKDEQIDVVVIGMTLEDMSGLELCRKIKEIDGSIYAIIISSWGVNLHNHTLKDAGVDAVLHKPFRIEQFKGALPKRELTDAPEN
jgi:CheY-like chemotaxis protein